MSRVILGALTSKNVGYCTYSIVTQSSHQPVNVIVRNYKRTPFTEGGCDDAISHGQGGMTSVPVVNVSMVWHG